jgi:hypothetical protein
MGLTWSSIDVASGEDGVGGVRSIGASRFWNDTIQGARIDCDTRSRFFREEGWLGHDDGVDEVYLRGDRGESKRR